MTVEDGSTVEDHDLIARARTGCQQAFAELIRRYQRAVFGIALARVRDFHLAEDIAQQVFLAAYKGLSGLKHPDRVGGWLRSLTIKHCATQLRRPCVRPDRLPQPAPVASPAELVQKQETACAVLDAIAQLPPATRETTVLFYLQERSLNDVADLQQIPVGTAKRRLHDARQKLRKEMLAIVGDTLNHNAPQEDFAERVFALLCQENVTHNPYEVERWRKTTAELQTIASRGLEGYARAMHSADVRTRVFAGHMLCGVAARPDVAPAIVDLLKSALHDASDKVRSRGLNGLLGGAFPEERKRREFVPLVVPMLLDRAKRVRRAAAAELFPFASDVPPDVIRQALAVERDPESRKRLERLSAHTPKA